MTQWWLAGRRRACSQVPGRDRESGFALVEVIVASLILMVTVVSITNVVIDSLSVAVLSRQTEAAASIASDTVENAKALGQVALSAGTAGPGCAPPAGTTLNTSTPMPVLNNNTLQVPYKTKLDGTVFTVCTTVSGSSTTADMVTVQLYWACGATNSCILNASGNLPVGTHSYSTSTKVGT